MMMSMDAGRTFGRRICWPAQDRVRATPPSVAPRISPVFTASVSLNPDACIPLGPRPASSPAAVRFLARSAPGTPTLRQSADGPDPRAWESEADLDDFDWRIFGDQDAAGDERYELSPRGTSQ